MEHIYFHQFIVANVSVGAWLASVVMLAGMAFIITLNGIFAEERN
jgi:hypothetical protein